MAQNTKTKCFQVIIIFSLLILLTAPIKTSAFPDQPSDGLRFGLPTAIDSGGIFLQTGLAGIKPGAPAASANDTAYVLNRALKEGNSNAIQLFEKSALLPPVPGVDNNMAKDAIVEAATGDPNIYKGQASARRMVEAGQKMNLEPTQNQRDMLAKSALSGDAWSQDRVADQIKSGKVPQDQIDQLKAKAHDDFKKKIANAEKARDTNGNKNPQGGDTANTKVCVIVPPGPSHDYDNFWGDPLTTAEDADGLDCFNVWPVPKTEDQVNFFLRTNDFAPLKEHDLEVALGCNKLYSAKQLQDSAIARTTESVGKNAIVKTIIPDKKQAEEFLANGFQGYTVDGGATMQPGNGYHPGDKTNKDINGKNVNISDSCQFTPMSQAEQDALKPGTKDGNPFSGPNRPGSQGGNPGDPGGPGGMEGMAGKLGELLKGLMSGLGKGNQQPSPSATPFVCPNTVSPVCGNNNITYRNSCEAEYKAQVGVKSVGYCPESPLAQCSTTWEPVCGNDNITYSNHCELQNMRTVTKVSSGICPNGIGTDSLTALSTVLKDATKTGIPSPLLENAIRAVAKLISNLVTNPGTVNEVTVP